MRFFLTLIAGVFFSCPARAQSALTDFKPTGANYYNVFAGRSVGNTTMSGGGVPTLATANMAFGQLVLQAVTTGHDNIGVGASVLNGITTGSNNIGIGSNVMAGATTANNNTGIGLSAMYRLTTGGHNTAVGVQAMWGITTGMHNTAVGRDALFSLTSSVWNTGVGVDACPGNSVGSYNTCVGGESGYGGIPPGLQAAPDQDLTGSYNTRLGWRAGAKGGMQNLNNSTAIGANAKVNKDNQVSLGNSDVTEFVFGDDVVITKAQLQALLGLLQ